MEKSTENPKKNQITPNNPKTRLILKESDKNHEEDVEQRTWIERSDVTKDDQRQ